MQAESHYRYEQISNTIRSAILAGSMKEGEKLNSVRTLSKQLGVSQSTVFRAYYDLESDGLIESRPKSGYYVSFQRIATSLPNTQNFKNVARLISNQELVTEFQSSLGHPLVKVDLGLAVPAPELLPLAKIKKSIQKSYLNDNQAFINYEPVEGNTKLRAQLSKLALSWGKSVKLDDVIVTNGCMEAISLSLSVLTKPGDLIAIESPAYYGLLQLIDNLQLKVIEIPGNSETGISMDFLEEVLKEKSIKAVLLSPNFNNPDGAIIPDEHKRQIVQWASQYQIPIIEDDIYGELYFGESRPKTCKTFDQYGWVIYCSSLSKTLMPGYRIGWCMPGKFRAEFLRKKSVTNIATSSIVQAIAAHYLEFGRYQYHLKKLRGALKIQHQQYNRAIFDHFPSKIPCSNPSGGFVLWLELKKSQDAVSLFRKGLESGIRIAPGQMFFAHPNYKNYFRISFGKPLTENVENAIKQLGQLATLI